MLVTLNVLWIFALQVDVSFHFLDITLLDSSNQKKVCLFLDNLTSVGTSYGPVSVSVCLSVTSRCSIKTNKWVELVFGMGASFHLSYTVLKGNSVISKSKVTSLWNFDQTPDLETFALAYWLSQHVIDLACKVDGQSVINWTVFGQLSWHYLRAPTVDH